MFPAFSRIWIINILLAGFVVFFGVLSFEVWSRGDEKIPEMQTGKSPEKALPAKGIAERTVPPDATFAIVAEKNLFSSSRSEIIPEKQKKQEGPLKISEKQIFLYGIMVVGNTKKALISNPDPGPNAGKKSVKDKWVTLGDTIGTFSVTDIQKDRLILADGANKHEILLFDKSKPARQVAAAQKPAAPTVVASGQRPAAAAAGTAAQPAGKTEQPASQAADGKSAPAPEYRIVNTPFGPTKQRIK